MGKESDEVDSHFCLFPQLGLNTITDRLSKSPSCSGGGGGGGARPVPFNASLRSEFSCEISPVVSLATR